MDLLLNSLWNNKNNFKTISIAHECIKGMKEWKYTYDTVNKSEWIDQIKKDLKDGPIEKLFSEWWPGETRIPFHHKEDVPSDPVVLPAQFFDSPPQIIEWITPSPHSNLVQMQISASLNYGAQSIIVEQVDSVEVEYAAWLRGVFPEMIHLALNTDVEKVKSDISWLSGLPTPSSVRIERGNISSSTFMATGWELERSSGHPVKFIYRFTPSDWIESTTRKLKQILNDLHHWANEGLDAGSYFSKCILVYDSPKEFFLQLIEVRSLQLLWLNILDQYHAGFTSGRSPVEFHIRPLNETDPNLYLVRAATSSLAASLSGVQGICIHHLTSEGTPDFYTRVDRNTHHLLHLESEMYKGSDPLAGSFTLDYYTRKWAEEIYQNLNA